MELANREVFSTKFSNLKTIRQSQLHEEVKYNKTLMIMTNRILVSHPCLIKQEQMPVNHSPSLFSQFNFD